MTLSLTALMALFQVAAGNGIVWQAPLDPPVPARSTSEIAAPAPGEPALPVWAVDDPYAWERSQCHPVMRGAEAMDHCQVRVRTQLKAALGGRLPSGLRPEAISTCRQASDGTGGYKLTCTPEQRTLTLRNAPAPEICDERPRAVPGGGVTFERVCRPDNAPDREGLSIPIFRSNR